MTKQTPGATDSSDRPALIDWVRLELWKFEGSDELPGELAERIVNKFIGPCGGEDARSEGG